MIRVPAAPMTGVERVSLALAIVLAIALMVPVRGNLTDDTFVHLRYAHHLAAGQGPVFNPGERVYGCSSPLWVALIADGLLLGMDGLVVARALGFLATLASVALFFQLLRRTVRHPVLRGVGTMAWAAHPWMLQWSMSGMETPLAVALMLAGFVVFTEGKQWGSRPVRTGCLWALAALARPEVVLLLLLWVILLVIDTSNRFGVRRLVFGLLPPVVIYGGWLVFARFYFGTFWPLSLDVLAQGGEATSRLTELTNQARVAGTTDGVLIALLVVALLLAGRKLWSPESTAQHLLPWLWIIALPALYLARQVPASSRYLMLVLPVLAWLAWRAADVWWLGEDPPPPRTAQTTVFGLVFGAWVLLFHFAVYGSVVLPHVSASTAQLESGLIAWGKWLRVHSRKEASIAAPDVGALGYFSGRRVVDTSGRLSPLMARLNHREGGEHVVAELSFSEFVRPDFLVDRSSQAYVLLERSRFAACLTPLGHAPEAVGKDKGARIYSIYRLEWPTCDRLGSHP